MRGKWQAAAVASALAFLSLLMPPVSILSSATIALVTLRSGIRDGFFVLLNASVIGALMSLVLLGNYQFALVYAFVLWVPVWIFSIVLRETRRLSLVMGVSAVFGLSAIVLAYVLMSEPAAIWSQALSQIVEPMISQSDASEMEIKAAIIRMSQYMTGLTTTGYIASLLFGLLCGRWWQAMLYNPGGFKQEFLALKAQPLFAVGSGLIILLALLGTDKFSEMAWNLSIPLFLFYIFIGIAVAHFLITGMESKKFFLPMFYVLVFMIPHALLPLAFVGLSDSWLNFRDRVSNHTSV